MSDLRRQLFSVNGLTFNQIDAIMAIVSDDIARARVTAIDAGRMERLEELREAVIWRIEHPGDVGSRISECLRALEDGK